MTVMASAGPYANQLHLVPDRLPHQYLNIQFFTGRMPFLPHNQQHQREYRENTCVIYRYPLMVRLSCLVDRKGL